MKPAPADPLHDPYDRPFGEHDLLRSVARSLGLSPAGGGLIKWIAAAFVAIAWVPLVVLAAVEGTLADGVAIPLLRSHATHVRFLLAIPLYFLAESVFGHRIHEVKQRIVESGIILPGDMTRFTAAWRAARSAWNSWHADLAMAIVTILSIYMGLRDDLPAGLSTWSASANGRLTLAGWWYRVVSLSLFQFVIWRWTWRLLVWVWLLWRVSRLDLQLVPTHPDRAGGLGPLGVAQLDLSPLALGSSAVVAATFAEEIAFEGAQLTGFAVPALAIVAGTVASLVGPLALFSHRLMTVKQRGLLEYGVLASAYTRAFHDKWMRGGTTESLLGTADLQSLADLGNSYGIVTEMQLVPMTWAQIVWLTTSAAVPMLPLMLFAYPLDELIIGGVRSLLGV
jgi:hypothetical protein